MFATSILDFIKRLAARLKIFCLNFARFFQTKFKIFVILIDWVLLRNMQINIHSAHGDQLLGS